MTARARRTRRRWFGAGAVATVLTLALTGCTLIQELQDDGGTLGGGPDEGPSTLHDETGALAEFYEQGLDWGDCPDEYAAEETAECATVSAPMNWNDPEEHEPIELALVRLPALGNAQGSLFTNPGGPGASGVDFVAQSGPYFFSEALRENFDIVSWDPRGVGYSSAVECRDDAGMDEFIYGVPEGVNDMSDEELFQLAQQRNLNFGMDCLENTGPLLEYVDTESTVNDLDLLRALVGDERLNYFGLSYGTDIGAKYIDRFPDRVNRVVLDGATDPTVTMFEMVIDQQTKFADATRTYLEDCLTGANCPFSPSGGVDGAIAEIQAIMEEVDETLPTADDGRVFTSGVMSTAISASMYSEQSWSFLTGAFNLWLTEQDPTVFFALSDSYYGRDTAGNYDSNMFEAFPAINCLDYPLVTDEAAIRDFNERLYDVALFAGEMTEDELLVGDLTCETWPVKSRLDSQEPVVGAGAPPVLVVATTNDPATPLKWAVAVAEQLESGVLLEFDGEGHIAYGQGDPCVVDAIDSYLIEGVVPEDGMVC